MQLSLPSEIESRLSPREAVLHLAIGLFVAQEVTLGQASEIAGVSQAEFMQELGRRKIPLHYGPDELAEDIQTIETLRPL
ncbi:MAG: UPF0175 family protein [Verrucomicrobiae bacterium]|nr:UPF0175 family protein [Verrucomicrobiae bacterium]MDW8310012.1 UPF0175 family protein [Verrucomicrobiales bacterium]